MMASCPEKVNPPIDPQALSFKLHGAPGLEVFMSSMILPTPYDDALEHPTRVSVPRYSIGTR